MAITADYHMHSNYSADSQSTMESMILSAIEKGLTHVCFTDHIDFEYPYGPNDDLQGKFEFNPDAYVYEAVRLKEKYEGKIFINVGLELGLQPHLARQNAIFAKQHEYDFIIGSSHVVDGMDPYNSEFFQGKTDEEAYRRYFESIYQNIKVYGNFDVYGHLDYVVRYGKSKNENFTYSKYGDIIDQILQNLIDNERGIECNTAGYDKGLNAPNPGFEILKRYNELGGEIITIGSDAHSPEKIAAHFDKAADILKAAGFRYYTIFDGRIPQFMKI